MVDIIIPCVVFEARLSLNEEEEMFTSESYSNIVECPRIELLLEMLVEVKETLEPFVKLLHEVNEPTDGPETDFEPSITKFAKLILAL